MLSVVEGEGVIDDVPVKKVMHLIVPHGYGRMRLQGNLSMIASAVGEGTRGE